MGSEESDDEKPPHLVNISSFYLGKYLVTQEQYLMIIGKNPARWQDAKLPVEQVSWQESQIFCQKLSAKTGKQYRLPSEAEWEYACRAGTTTPFYYGETLSTELANYDGSYIYKSGVVGEQRRKTTPIDKFLPNGFGLHDMHGNTWEWCLDGWYEDYQGAPADGSSWCNEYSDYRVMRGGCWTIKPDYCRSANRTRRSETNRDNNIGFRVVCEN